MEKNKLILVLKKIGFKEHLGYYIKNDYKIFLEDSFIVCHENFELIFQIKDDIELGTLLVILQQYQIFHERYCYEVLEGIEERFEEEEDEEN